MKSDFALMSSTYPNYIIVVRANHMQTALFFTFFPFIDSFEDNVRFFWLIDGNHFHLEIFSFGYHSWEGFFADFALELSEVV